MYRKKLLWPIRTHQFYYVLLQKLLEILYIDFSKAFDMLIHGISLEKMGYYGVNGFAKNLLQSYLVQRQQVVGFNGFFSDRLEIKTGVPQGSVLGPFLFSLYINDLPSWTDLINKIMYADDITL